MNTIKNLNKLDLNLDKKFRWIKFKFGQNILKYFYE
jgi:hypothetical protein